MGRKDSFESALVRNNQAQQPRGQQLSMYSQLGGQQMPQRDSRRPTADRSMERQNLYYEKGQDGSGMASPTDHTSMTQQAKTVFPRIKEGTPNTSEYLGGGGAISQIGYGSHIDHSISTNPHNAASINASQMLHHHNQQMSMQPPQIASEEALAYAAMNARFEQSKGVMSPSPDIKATTPQGLSNKKAGAVNYYSNRKSPMRNFHVEQMSGQTMTAEGSFIDAPPIPYRGRYKADIHNHSASTMVPQQSEPKFRRNLNHPERAETTANNQHNSEYYTMGEVKHTESTHQLNESKSSVPSQHLGKGGESRAMTMSAKKLSASQQQVRRQDDNKSQLKSSASQNLNLSTSKGQIRYATPNADKHDSSSNKEGYGQQPSYLHKTLEMQSVLGNLKAGQNKRSKKNKNYSDSSMLHLNHAQNLRMSPIAARQQHEDNFNLRSQKCILSALDQQESISMFRENMKRGRASKKQTPGNFMQLMASHQMAMEADKDHRSSHNQSATSARRSNGLFDMRQRASLPDSYYQDQSVRDNMSSSHSMNTDVCMQIATQALSKCYDIVPQLAQQLIADTKEQINYYRKQISFNGDSNQNKRVILSPHESSVFFNTISDRFYQKSDLIIEKNYDLRPILSMILLGLQDYQSEKTKIDALKCIKFLADINNGHFRAKIWKWIKYTTIKEAKPSESREMITYPKKRSKVNVHVQGFIQSIHDIIGTSGSPEMSMLACRTVVDIAQKSLFELFINQLPTLFSDRAQYLGMFNEQFQLYQKAMADHVDEIERTSLLRRFIQLNIPNFIVAQCLCLIEGNLVNFKEAMLENFVPGSSPSVRPESAMFSQRSKRTFQKIQDEHSMVISLLCEIWLTVPSLFSSLQQTEILQHEYEQDDFGLQERLSKDNLQNTISKAEVRKRLLGTKVLTLFKRVSSSASLAVKLTMITRLFSVLEVLSMEMDDFAENIYRLLVFFLVEWHDNKVARSHLLINFSDLFKQDKVLSLTQLTEPLCSIIVMNLKKDEVKQRKYLTLSDFSFMWDLANKPRITAESALAICQVLQIYMIKRDPQYRGVAEKIFLKLIGRFATEEIMHTFMKKHCDDSVEELAAVDMLIRTKTNKVPDMLLKSHELLEKEDKHSQNSDEFEMQLQIHYLFKHLLLIARGKAQQTHNLNATTDSAAEREFRFMCQHIVTTIQNKLNGSPPGQQSPILISLLKKLQFGGDTMSPERIPAASREEMLALNNSTSLREESTLQKSEKQMTQEEAIRQNAGSRLGITQSHETLLTPMKHQIQMTDQIKKEGPTIYIDQTTTSGQPSNISPDLQASAQMTQHIQNIDLSTVKHQQPAMTNSSDYEPTRYNKTIIDASLMFQEVRNAEEARQHAKTSLALSPDQQTANPKEMSVSEQNPKASPLMLKPKQVKEMGTDYDPPVELQSAGIQTKPVQKNKKMQVSIHGTSTLEGNSSIDPKVNVSVERKNVEQQTSNNVGKSGITSLSATLSSIVNNSAAQPVEKKNKTSVDMQLTKPNKKEESMPITPIQEVEAEEMVSPPQGSIQRIKTGANKQDTTELDQSKTDSKAASLHKTSSDYNKDDIKVSPEITIDPRLGSSLSQRTVTIAPDKQIHEFPPSRHQPGPQKQKTAKVDVREALEKIRTNLDSVTKNLKESHANGYSQNGTTFRTEIYNTDGEGPENSARPRDDKCPYQLKPLPDSAQITNAFDGSQEGSEAQPREDIKKPATLNKYNSKRRILVSLQQEEDRQIKLDSQRGARPRNKSCVHCFKNGIDTASHTSANCPMPHKKISKLADNDLKTRQKMANLDLQHNSQSQLVLPIHEIRTTDYFEKSGRYSTLDPSAYNPSLSQKQLLTINRLPEIQKQNLGSTFEPQSISSRRQISYERHAPNEGKLSVVSKAVTTPRNQQYVGLPISLPKMSDFWRGNPLGQTQYGDTINYQSTPQVPPPQPNINVAMPQPQQSQAPLSRYMTQMSMAEEEEMSEAFTAHNRRLQEKQKLMLQLANNLPKRAQTQAQMADEPGSVEGNSPPGNLMKKTGYSWVSGNTQNVQRTTNPLVSKQDRQKEVKRLEKAVERLLINLGSDQDLVQYNIVEEEEPVPEEPKPVKREAEDNKLSNTFQSVQPVEESVEEVPKEMKSFVTSLRNGYLGVGSGVASPIELEIQDESINIVKPEVYDPMHPGLANLSPTQLGQLKQLAAKKDDDQDLTYGEEKDLDKLLDLIENGIKVDGRHPGMINLTPDQQQQFLKLYDADCLNNPPLPPEKKKALNKLKDLIVHGTPLDSNHPGVVNLSPNEKKDLIRIEKKQDNVQPLTPQEEENLGYYKTQIAHGQPIDSSHPGVVNLTENQKDMLRDFERRPDLMSKNDEAEDEKIKNLIVHGTPLDQSHPGCANLSPDELDRFKQLLKPEFKTPKIRNELNSLQEKVLEGDPIDENHAGMVNITPVLQEVFKQLLDKKQNGEPLSQAQQQKLKDLMNRVANGRPLDKEHPGMANLTPGQQTDVKGLIRRKQNGDILSPDDARVLQNLQNLMLFGKPLGQGHPGFSSLKPTDQKRFEKLNRDRLDGKQLTPENENALEKLGRKQQINSGPLGSKHEGFNNLMPDEQDAFQNIQRKQADRAMMDPDEREELDRLKGLMRPAFPYDKNHPGFDSLTGPEQKQLLNCNKKDDAGVPLSPQEEASVKEIKANMDNPTEFGENHPGWNNLVPKEKARFKQNAAKEEDGVLNPNEEHEQDYYKDVMKHGRPIDENHPGFDNLNPMQQDRFRDIFKLREDGKNLTPDESEDMDNLEDIIVNGIPIDENHPGFKGLDPYQKKRFKNLKPTYDDRELSPMQQKEMDQLRTSISPSYFSPDLAAALRNLNKKQKDKDLGEEEQEQKDRLEELKRLLPNIENDNALTPQEKALLNEYLTARLFEEPLTQEQLDEMNDLLKRDSVPEKNLDQAEQDRMMILVKMMYKGAELDPEEEKEMLMLHRKQNKGIGGLTPSQFRILGQLKELQDSGQRMTPSMLESLNHLQTKQDLPSPLNPQQEDELAEMEASNKRKDISPVSKDRLKAFWRMRYHPQLLDLEDRALFYFMKDLESLPELDQKQEDQLFALQKRFNCLPWITPKQISYMDNLNAAIGEGKPLTPLKKKDLYRLESLPMKEPLESDIPPLTPIECRDYKQLKAKRDRGDQMKPEELGRYRDLKDKIKKHKEEEEKANQSVRTPIRVDRSPDNTDLQKSNIKTPDDRSRRAPKRKLTFAPPPSVTQDGSSLTLPHNVISPTSQMKLNSHTPNAGEEVSPRSSIQKSERRAAQAAFKKAIKIGKATLKELITQFYIIEENYMIKDFYNGIRTNFNYALAISKSNQDESHPTLTLVDFLKYAMDKKIKFKQHHVIEILRGESEQNNIKFASFVKLLILASCGGDRTKIGLSNFKKLMNHMDIFK